MEASGVNVVEADEENGYGGNRVQPFASTPRPALVKDNKFSCTLRDMLGLEEIFSPSVCRASLAELVGTAVLVFVMDTIVISSYETQTKTPNLVFSLSIAILVTILLIATSPISGGHINPVFSWAAMSSGLITFSRALVYTLAQCAGAVVGALALKAVANSNIERAFSLGGCTVNVAVPSPQGLIDVGLGTGRALWLEIFCTFIFLFASIWTALDHCQALALGRIAVCTIIGLVVGLLVFISTTATATKGYSGVGMNPARCLGPALVRGGHLWTGHWVFWVGPIIACVGFFLYTKIIPRELINICEQKQ